jgi:predicted secreted protein with PEFG-CTERM motif
MIPKILLIVCAISFFILPAFSQLLLEITLSEEVYFEGDVIFLSGNVSTVIPDNPVTLQLIRIGEGDEESIVQIAQIEVAQDGTFSHTVKAEGPQWKSEGEYVVRAFYGIDNIADVYFDFFKKGQEASLIFEVEKPDQSGTFDIEYLIRGGNVTDVIVDQEFFELIVLIQPESDGAITLELPRSAIDAKRSDGTDDTFIILIDGIEVPFTETQNDVNTRTITIEFEETDSDIEIIGTFVIPEFGTIASLVLAISIISIIIISSKRNFVRI